jgi:RNA polymerase sigma-70 factor (ECF subfamily)
VTVDLDVHLPRIAAGDPAAFGQWIAGAERSLRESLRSFAARVDVEAVLQEALLRTWQVAPRVEVDGAPNALLRMALRIARNLAIDEVRRARTTTIGDDDLDASLAFAVNVAPPDPLLRRAIAFCRDRLPEQPRRALDARLASAGSEPDATLAAGLRMKLNTFLQNFGRARKLLADCLRERGVDLGATP